MALLGMPSQGSSVLLTLSKSRIDGSLNEKGFDFERRKKQKVMSSFHAVLKARLFLPFFVLFFLWARV